LECGIVVFRGDPVARLAVESLLFDADLVADDDFEPPPPPPPLLLLVPLLLSIPGGDRRLPG
jgi:hypothetical protein